ncbi:hypothetical protein MHK_000059 [Candidatus Magnetomorum sp. HK-1]|nr:hypothetical protein MHK_000059 [Candidatus Magnetomorum sp. HK-1]
MVIEISSLNKQFKGVDAEPDFVLDLPNIMFKTGKIVYVMGHNGSGKSIFLRLLAGEILPSAGCLGQ